MQQETDPSDYFGGLAPEPDAKGEEHDIQISLDDGTQIVEYFVKLIVGDPFSISALDLNPGSIGPAGLDTSEQDRGETEVDEKD